MFKLLICVMIYISPEICLCQDSVIENTELVLAYMIHRHGDRTPVPETIAYATDPEKVLELTNRYGFGQLTDKGIARGYELGKFIRRRYDAQLSEHYNRSEIYIRSTDSTRTKMTILSAMAAVYPAGPDNWSEAVNWTPVPYTTIPAKYDSMLAVINCPVFASSYTANLMKPAPSMEKYNTILKEISEIFGNDIAKMPTLLFVINDMFLSQISLGVPVPAGLEALLPEIEEAAGEAMNLIFGDKKYLALQSGVLLKGFFDAADSILSGQDIPKIQVYSAHDATVFPFRAVTKITPRLGIPKYASLYSLELRRDLQTGKYIVVPVYLEQPGIDEVYLQTEGCEGFCDLESFRLVTSEYILNETEWRTLCGWSEDYDFDTSSID